MSYCLKCDEDIEELVGFKSIGEIIECPNCGNEMYVNYDESYDPETGDEGSYFWLTNEN